MQVAAPNTPEPRLKRYLRRFLVAAACLLVPAVVLACCVGPPWYYFEKYSPAPESASVSPDRRPWQTRATLLPERQTEPHTCGLHTLSAIYRAYGLDPEALRLRFRVGVDKPLSNLLPDTTGSIHPDMLRVLRQDGFDTEVLLPSAAQTPARLKAHLDAGHVAAALIRINELHWVALSKGSADSVRVCDSLQETPYEQPLGPYVRDSIYSLLLIRPAPP